MAQISIDDILGELIPSPPFIYRKLQEVLNDPDSNIEDISGVINVDPGLTTRLLKIVNSPFYGLSSEVDSISHAINILGTEQLVDLVLATEVMNKFRGIPRDMIDLEEFWKHSIACGLASRMIAKKMNEQKPERFYLAGMLHDIGTLILCKEVPSTARECLAQSTYKGEHLYKTETSILGFNHADLGRALLKKWSLPERTVEAVGFHHTPLQAKSHPRFATIVHVADIMAYEMKVGNSGEPFIPPISIQVLEHLEIKKDTVDKIKKDIAGEVGKIMQKLG